MDKIVEKIFMDLEELAVKLHKKDCYVELGIVEKVKLQIQEMLKNDKPLSQCP